MYLYPSCCQLSWRNGPGLTGLSRNFFIQQDGARNHIGEEDDKEFNDTLTEQDINMKLNMQVANSPDINLLNS